MEHSFVGLGVILTILALALYRQLPAAAATALLAVAMAVDAVALVLAVRKLLRSRR